jgi:transposase-like protein
MEIKPEDFKAWMAQHGYSVRKLAPLLGVAPRTIQRWRDGKGRIPPYLSPALEALEDR